MAECKEGTIPPENAKFFNSFPHVNFDFDNISSTFRPTDEDYLQNLILYSAIPASFGIVVFLVLGVHFIVHCCKWCCKRCRKLIAKRRTKTKCALCLTICVWLIALTCCGSIIAGYVVNDNIDNGVMTVTTAIENVTDTFETVHLQVSSIQNNVLDMKDSINDMLHLPGIPGIVSGYLDDMKSSILQIIDEMNKVKPIDTPDISGDIKTGEYYRWWSVFGGLSVTLLTNLIAIYSSIRFSRCGFFLALLMGCISFLIDWLVIGAHFGASIGMSDLCVSPRKTVDFYLKSSSFATKDIVNYYLDCKSQSIHPFEKYVDFSLDYIVTANDFLNKVKTFGWAPLGSDLNKLTSDLQSIGTTLHHIQDNFKCERIKRDYHTAHCAVCFPVVEGLSVFLVLSLVFGVTLVMVLLLISLMCRRVHKKRRPSNFMISLLNGNQSEETEYYSATSDEESMPLVPSTSPPPYEAVARSVDFQFHSCHEERNRANSTVPQPDYQPVNQTQDNASISQQQNIFAPPPLRGEVVMQRKVTMAF